LASSFEFIRIVIKCNQLNYRQLVNWTKPGNSLFLYNDKLKVITRDFISKWKEGEKSKEAERQRESVYERQTVAARRH
jgi:hypothetical protein